MSLLNLKSLVSLIEEFRKNDWKIIIAIEGVDGCGKTTLAKKLKNLFPTAKLVKNPTTTDGEEERCLVSQEIRDLIMKYHHSSHLDPIAEISLFASSIIQNTSENISNTEGNLIICDRFLTSFIVYSRYAMIDFSDEEKEAVQEILHSTSQIIDKLTSDWTIIEIYMESNEEMIKNRILSGRDIKETNLSINKVINLYKDQIDFPIYARFEKFNFSEEIISIHKNATP